MHAFGLENSNRVLCMCVGHVAEKIVNPERLSCAVAADCGGDKGYGDGGASNGKCVASGTTECWSCGGKSSVAVGVGADAGE